MLRRRVSQIIHHKLETFSFASSLRYNYRGQRHHAATVSKLSTSSSISSDVIENISLKHVEMIEKKYLVHGGHVLTDDLEKYNVDWTKQYRGKSKIVVQPNTVAEISNLLSYCNSNGIHIVPQSGNTGLVGGSVPIDDEIILSMEKLNNIIDS